MNTYLASDTLQKRVRHVTAVQIRNLTPFPARDAFASALTQPAEQPQFTPHGHLSDDLDLALSRKRGRRISTNSVANRTIPPADIPRDDIALATSGEVGRRPSTSRVSFSESSDRGRHNSTSGSTPTVRRRRPRTTSLGSPTPSIASGLSPSTSLSEGKSVVRAPFSSISHDTTQSALETVIESRLVNTFLAISIPPPSTPEDLSLAAPRLFLGSRNRSYTLHSQKPSEVDLLHKAVKPLSQFATDRTPNHIRRELKGSAKPPLKSSPTHVKSASVSRINRDPTQASSHLTLQMQKPPVLAGPSTPNYFSSIHRPSTNPYFSVDVNADLDDDRADISGSMMKVEVWGKVPGHAPSRKGKEKMDAVGNGDAQSEWRVLEEWSVDLENLVPLSHDLVAHPSRFPSNSLLVTLSPPGNTFYLPPRTPSGDEESLAVSTGYSSDPESEVRKMKQSGESPIKLSSGISNAGVDMNASHTERHEAGANHASSDKDSKTATYQELIKLANLQSCIIENEYSLHIVMCGIERVLEAQNILAQRREVSEREARLEEFTANHNQVLEESLRLKHEVHTRTEDLKQRRYMLALAKEQLQEEADAQHEMALDIAEHRVLYQSLQARFGPTRTTLLNILSSVFPIELYSPPDLLYTILDIPLPIPLSASDPAPPLTLPKHKDVTEEAIATSLGYVAQVVYLLAGYLGKRLVYPVTCIGSRSLIRDDISAMVGPRMFPLYSKGVDAYRFEYGVFLLNKDIELLMADRDLRALDMRHTLPNLKNLLLTLTSGEGALLQRPRPPDSPMSLASNVESEEVPSVESTNAQEKTTTGSDTLGEGSTTPPASGTITPTGTTTGGSGKSRMFISLSPLSGFFRARQPSTSSSDANISNHLGTVHDSPRPGATPQIVISEDQDAGVDDDEEDRKTISGVPRDADPKDVKNKKVGGSLALNGEEEKLRRNSEDLSSLDVDPSIHY